MDLFGDLPPPADSGSSLVSSDPEEEEEEEEEKEEKEEEEEELRLDSTSRSMPAISSTVDKLDFITSKKRKHAEESSLPKKSKQDHGMRWRSCVAELKGEREEMQDAHTIIDDWLDCVYKADCDDKCAVSYYGLFDGHAGFQASRFAAANLHANIQKEFPTKLTADFDKALKKCLLAAFKKTDEAFLQEASQAVPQWKDGSTGVCVIVVDNTIYAASLGDSKVILVRKGCRPDRKPVIIRLSKEHSPLQYDERQRIQKAGGYVRDGRVLGILEVSRSFGDARFKKYGVISLPDVTKHALTDDDRYILIACDGLWKGLSEEEVVEFIDRALQKGGDGDLCGKYEQACKDVASEAIRRGSSDNVTVMLVNVAK